MAASTAVTLELNAIDGATAVIRQVKGSVDTLKSSYENLATAVKGLGAALGVGVLASWVESSIEAINRLREMSIATGVTVETLSALRSVAKESGADMDQVATMVQKLSKNMFEFAETGKGKAAQAFEHLGMSQEQVREGMKDMNAFLPEFAKRLVESGNSTEVVAMAQQLLGKSGAQALPFLQALAEQMKLMPLLTSEQAEQAHQYVVAMKQLEGSANVLRNQMALGLLPSMLQIVQTFVDLKGKQGDVTDFFQAIGSVAKNVAGIVGSLWLGLKDMADGIGALAAQGAMLLRGDLAGARAIGLMREQSAAKNEAAYQAMWSRLNAPPPPLPTPSRRLGLGGGGGGSDGGDTPAGWTPQMEEMFQARRAAYKESEAMTAAAEKAAADAARAQDKLNASYEQEAEQLRRMIDPARVWNQRIVETNLLQEKGIITQEEATAAIAKYQEQIDKLNTVDAPKTDEFARKMGLTFSSAFENAIVKGKALRDVITGIGQDIAQVITRMTITEPAGQAISQAIQGSGVTDWAKGLFSGAHAMGGTIPSGTWGIVGENGPEPVFAGAGGAVVTPNSGSGDSSGGDTYYIDARGADQAGLARLAAAIRSVNASVESRAVNAWQKAMNQRGYSTGLAGG